MNKLYDLNLCHLVLSPSPNDAEKLRGYTPFIINWIFNKSNISFYSISEELGENHDHFHLDILIFAKTNIETNILNNKGKQIGLAGHLKEFMLNNMPSSQWGVFYKDKKENIRNEKEHNVKYLIGYNQKETEKYSHTEEYDIYLQNWNNLPIDEDQIMKCIMYMKEHRVDKKTFQKDVIPLYPKNCMFEMKKFLKKDMEYHTIISDSVKKGYCWVGMSKKQTRTLILQLKVIKDCAEQWEIDELNEDTFSDISSELSIIQEIRHRPDYQRLILLKQHGFITQTEYDQLVAPAGS